MSVQSQCMHVRVRVRVVKGTAECAVSGGGKASGSRWQPDYNIKAAHPSLFSVRSNPLANCKLYGKGIQKIYDKSVKGYVYSINGGPSAKLQIPKDDTKSGLQLVHPYLVLQLFVPLGQHFSLELRLSDATNTRRKMYLSTSFSELKMTPLHCRIPLSMIMHNTWLSFSIHVADLFYSCFRVKNFRSIDVVVLGPVCKLRKVFTMRNRLADPVAVGNFAIGIEDCLPPEHTFASGVIACFQVLDTAKLQSVLCIEIPNFDGSKILGSSDPSLSTKRLLLNKGENGKQVHVAFGSRVPPPLLCTNLSSDLSEEQSRLPQHKIEPSGPPSSQDSEPIDNQLNKKERVALDVMKGPKKINGPDSKFPEMRVAAGPHSLLHNTKNSGKKSTDEDNLDSENLTGNRNLTLKHNRGARKKEDIFIRRNLPAIPNVNSFAKCGAGGTNAKGGKQSSTAESPPWSPPCGWDRHSNSDEVCSDMLFSSNFLDSPSFSETDLNHDGCALITDDLQAKKKSVLAFQQNTGNLVSEVHEASKTNREDDLREVGSSRRVPSPRNIKGGTKFYQYELENGFLLKEDNSDSATDEGSEEDFSWSSCSLGRYNDRRLDRCARSCETLPSAVHSEQADGFIVNTELLPTDYEVEERSVPESFGSIEEQFIVHLQDTTLINALTNNEKIARNNISKFPVGGDTSPSSDAEKNNEKLLELESQIIGIERETLEGPSAENSASKFCE